MLRDVYDAHAADGLALVAISVQETTPDDVRAYVQRYGLPFTVGFDATSASSTPITRSDCRRSCSSTRDGVIRNVVLGPVNRAQVEQILAPLLSEPGASTAP